MKVIRRKLKALEKAKDEILQAIMTACIWIMSIQADLKPFGRKKKVGTSKVVP